MREFALRATRLNRLIEEKGYRAIEAHPTSTRKALHMPLKDWSAIQENLKALIPKGDAETRSLATHEYRCNYSRFNSKIALEQPNRTNR